MKKILHFTFLPLICLCIFVFNACTDEVDLYNSAEQQISKYIPEPIVLPTNSLDWDVSYHPNLAETRANENHSHEMAVVNNNVFVGAVYTAASVNDLTFLWVPNQVKPIDVAYTFPRYYFDQIQRPSVVGMYRSLSKAVQSSSFTGKQSLSFEYDYRQFSYYQELKLAFGANVNIAGLFKLDASVGSTKINSKSGLFARIVQKNFALIMDYPIGGNIFQNESDLSSLLPSEPLYVNSIIFGRMAIIAVESSYEYDELKVAFQAALTAGKIGAELNISAEHKKILEESQMKICVSGGAGQEVAKIVEGYHEFKNFIISGGEFTTDVPGVPIFLTANYVRDNSVFNTTFVTK